jgi:Ca2+/Na+ antiporter
LIRDTAFYSVALLLLVLFFVDDMIYWWEALILFLWYGAYVLFMKFNVVAEAKFLAIFPSLKAKVSFIYSRVGRF